MEDSRSEGNLNRFVLAGLLIILGIAAFAMRFSLMHRSIRHDEAHSYIFYVLGKAPKYLWDYSNNNNHVFHSLLMDVSVNALGNGVWAIRLPAFIAGMLILPATYVVAQRFYDRRTAAVAMALVAVNAPLIEYSANARGYTIHTLLVLLQFFTAYEAIRKDERRYWIGLVVCSALSFYTVPTALYTMGAVALWMLAEIWIGFREEERRRRLAHFFMAMVAAGVGTILLYSPILINDGPGAITSNSAVARRTGGGGGFTGRITRLLDRLEYFYLEWGRPTWSMVILLVGLPISLLVHRKIATHRVPLHVWPVIWVTLVVIIQRVTPPERTLMPFITIYLICIAAGLVFVGNAINHYAKLPSWLVVSGLALGILVGYGAFLPGYGAFDNSFHSVPNPDAESFTETLIEIYEPGDIVVADGLHSITPRYYALRKDFPLPHIWDEYSAPPDLLTQPSQNRVFVYMPPIESLDEAPFDYLDITPPPGEYSLELLETYSAMNLYELVSSLEN